MAYLWQSDELICYDVIHPTQYVFHEDTETCTPVYTEYSEDYDTFYRQALEDVEQAKRTRDTAWTPRTIQTGLTLPIFPGFPTIR